MLMGRRQFHAGEEGQGGNFGYTYTKGDMEQMSVFPVKFTEQF